MRHSRQQQKSVIAALTDSRQKTRVNHFQARPCPIKIKHKSTFSIQHQTKELDLWKSFYCFRIFFYNWEVSPITLARVHHMETESTVAHILNTHRGTISPQKAQSCQLGFFLSFSFSLSFPGLFFLAFNITTLFTSSSLPTTPFPTAPFQIITSVVGKCYTKDL